MAEIKLKELLEKEAAILFDDETLELMRSPNGRKGLSDEDFNLINGYSALIISIYKDLTYGKRKRLNSRVLHYLCTGD